MIAGKKLTSVAAVQKGLCNKLRFKLSLFYYDFCIGIFSSTFSQLLYSIAHDIYNIDKINSLLLLRA